MNTAIKEFIFNAAKRYVKDEIDQLIFDTVRRRDEADEEDVELSNYIVECYSRFYDEISNMKFSAQQTDTH